LRNILMSIVRTYTNQIQ